jgi:hypothetical protein
MDTAVTITPPSVATLQLRLAGDERAVRVGDAEANARVLRLGVLVGDDGLDAVAREPLLAQQEHEVARRLEQPPIPNSRRSSACWSKKLPTALVAIAATKADVDAATAAAAATRATKVTSRSAMPAVPNHQKAGPRPASGVIQKTSPRSMRTGAAEVGTSAVMVLAGRRIARVRPSRKARRLLEPTRPGRPTDTRPDSGAQRIRATPCRNPGTVMRRTAPASAESSISVVCE